MSDIGMTEILGDRARIWLCFMMCRESKFNIYQRKPSEVGTGP